MKPGIPGGTPAVHGCKITLARAPALKGGVPVGECVAIQPDRALPGPADGAMPQDSLRRSTMVDQNAEIVARAAALAEELAAGVVEGRAVEWVEQLLVTALIEVARRERERCAAIAEHRAAIWEASARGMAMAAHGEALAEARARRKEALVVADALLAGAAIPER